MDRAVALAAAVMSLCVCLRSPLLLLLQALNGGWLISRIDKTESIKPAILANFRPFFNVMTYGFVFNTRQTALLFLQNAKALATETDNARGVCSRITSWLLYRCGVSTCTYALVYAGTHTVREKVTQLFSSQRVKKGNSNNQSYKVNIGGLTCNLCLPDSP